MERSSSTMLKIVALCLLWILLWGGILGLATGARGSPEPDYPGKVAVVTEMESAATENGTYGNWTLSSYTDSSDGVSCSRSFLAPGALGSTYASVVQLTDPNSTSHSSSFAYTFRANVTEERSYRLHTIGFYYKLTTDNSSATVPWLTADYLDANGTYYALRDFDLTLSSSWKYVEVEIYDPAAAQVNLSIGVTVTGEAEITLRIDHVTCIAPPCCIRFSFYNYYTGLGLISELLIPEVWHDGTWIRVWDNQVEIAAGETISYRVRDYFGQTISWTPIKVLNATTIYLDISVRLVKVHIARPEWWTSELPPEWQITYLPSGTRVSATGWEVDLIAGWYRFSWPEQKVTNTATNLTDEGKELIIENGTVDQQIQGDLPRAMAYTMSDFFLQMEPTYSGTYNPGNVIDPSLTTWDGWVALAEQFLDQFQKSLEFKILIFVGALMTLWGLIIWLRRRAKELRSGEPIREGRNG